MPGILYVVATPIGNIEEITTRALTILSEVDIVAAEDTRTTKLMLNILGLKAPKFTSYHKFNEKKKQDSLLEELAAGKNIALVSEAGTPCISDPGYYLVCAAAKRGIQIMGISGPCAAITALSISGFPAEPFTFLGFLPKKDKEIAKIFKALDNTVIFYESPKRITATMGILAEQYPSAGICLCNDISKQYERIYRGTPPEIIESIAANPHAEKGEYTCVMHLTAASGDSEGTSSAPSLESLLIDIMVKSGCDMKAAIKTLSAEYAKNEIYAASLRLKELV